MWVRFPPSAPIFILTFPRISVTITASFCVYPPVAQLVEQLPLKEMVAGSNPAGRTILKIVDVFHLFLKFMFRPEEVNLFTSVRIRTAEHVAKQRRAASSST